MLQKICPLCGGALDYKTFPSKALECKQCGFHFKFLEYDQELFSSIYKEGNGLVDKSLYEESYETLIRGVQNYCGDINNDNRKLCLNSAYNASVVSKMLLDKTKEAKWLSKSLHLLLWIFNNGDQGEDALNFAESILKVKLNYEDKISIDDKKDFKELENIVSEKEKKDKTNSFVSDEFISDIENSEADDEDVETDEDNISIESDVDRGEDKTSIECNKPRDSLIGYDSNGLIGKILLGCSSNTFSSIGGYTKVKDELFTSIILGAKRPDLLRKYNLPIKSNIVLYGPPGNGKTTYIKALAGEANIPFLMVSPSTVLNMYTGNSERNISKIFEFAKKNSPLILAFDELDGLGHSRSLRINDSLLTVISQLLYEMSALQDESLQLYIIGTTNNPWVLDPALMRAGRFDKWIFVPHPNKEERKEIFSFYLNSIANKDNIDVESLAEMTEWASAAEIQSIVKETLYKKVKEEYYSNKGTPLSQSDLEITIKGKTNLGVVTKAWYTEAIRMINGDSNLIIDSDVIDYLNKIKDKLHNTDKYESRGYI